MKKVTITFEDDDDCQDSDFYDYEDWYKTEDPCKNCPNRPRNGEMKACACTLPYYHGPMRVTCIS